MNLERLSAPGRERQFQLKTKLPAIKQEVKAMRADLEAESVLLGKNQFEEILIQAYRVLIERALNDRNGEWIYLSRDYVRRHFRMLINKGIHRLLAAEQDTDCEKRDSARHRKLPHVSQYEAECGDDEQEEVDRVDMLYPTKISRPTDEIKEQALMRKVGRARENRQTRKVLMDFLEQINSSSVTGSELLDPDTNSEEWKRAEEMARAAEEEYWADQLD